MVDNNINKWFLLLIIEIMEVNIYEILLEWLE